MTHSDPVQGALARIAGCNDPKALRQIAINALAKSEAKVWRAAQLRLYDVLPSAKPGTLEYDVWRSIFALEGELKVERKRSTLLSRTRQKIKRDGEHGTVRYLILGAPSEGFRMLIDRDLPRLTFEAVALRHAERFEQHVLDAAETRLREAGLEPTDLMTG